MVEWAKTNIIAALTLLLLVGSSFVGAVQYHSNLENKLDEVNTKVVSMETYINKQIEMDSRLLLVEAKTNSIMTMIEKQAEIVNTISGQNVEARTQAAVIDTTVKSLNATLDKVNVTLDKLNSTVNNINYDIVEIKSEIKSIKKEKGDE